MRLMHASADKPALFVNAGTSLQNAGVADDSLPAVRAYLHQVGVNTGHQHASDATPDQPNVQLKVHHISS